MFHRDHPGVPVEREVGVGLVLQPLERLVRHVPVVLVVHVHPADLCAWGLTLKYRRLIIVGSHNHILKARL